MSSKFPADTPGGRMPQGASFDNAAPYGKQGAAKPVDPDGSMGVMGTSGGVEGAHHGAIRGMSVGPAEGIQRAEQGGTAAVGGSPLAAAIESIMKMIAARSGVPQPNPAPAVPQIKMGGS